MKWGPGTNSVYPFTTPPTSTPIFPIVYLIYTLCFPYFMFYSNSCFVSVAHHVFHMFMFHYDSSLFAMVTFYFPALSLCFVCFTLYLQCELYFSISCKLRASIVHIVAIFVSLCFCYQFVPFTLSLLYFTAVVVLFETTKCFINS